MSRLAVDPTTCTVRHIVRCHAADDGAVLVGRVYFRAAAPEGVNGRAGWISAEVQRVLCDDAQVTVRFPNGAGADGQLHRDRFSCLTNSLHRPGEEWLQINVDGSPDPLAVVTTVSAKVGRTEIVLSCMDPLAPTAMTREETLHPVCAAPRDVIDFYGRLEMAWALRSFTGWASTGSGVTADGWTYAAVSPGAGSVRLTGAGSSIIYGLSSVADPEALDVGWTVTVAGLLIAGELHIDVMDASVILRADTHDVGVGIPGAAGVGPTPIASIGPSKPFSVRVYRRGRWLFSQVNGQTVAILKIPAGFAGDFGIQTVAGGDAEIDQVTISGLQRYITSPDTPGDLHLPGEPTPGGLAARYFREDDARALCAASFNVAGFGDRTFNPQQPEYADRIDGPINFATALPPAWMPAGPPDGHWWSARWTGAIYLDLHAGDRTIRVVNGNGDGVSVWVGRTGPGVAPLLTRTTGGSGGGTTSTGLRAYLGQQVSGWYPIIIELQHTFDTGGLQLLDGPAGGTMTVVPASRLSPFGIFENQVQRESHRAMITQVTDAFGLQWAIEPCSLESGRFPGRLAPKVRAGRDVDVTITSDSATAIESTITATDCADRLVVDAAGLADPNGASSLAAEVWNIDAASDHLYVSTAWDSAAEITDDALLHQRADSLLALRSGPNEQVSVTPPGARTLVDTWPLTGALARMKWEPGDAAIIRLPEIAIVDTVPRQFTGITWVCRPDGMGDPQVTWRTRQKGARALLRRLISQSAAGRRTYQGQLAKLVGSLGASNVLWAPDGVTRLHVHGHDVAKLQVHVSGGPGVLVVNGITTPLTVQTGVYDVTDWKAIDGAAQQYATLSGASGAFIVALVATVAT